MITEKRIKEAENNIKSYLNDGLLKKTKEKVALKIAEIRSDELIESFDFERRKRSFIQYKTPKEDILDKAKVSFKRAQEFVFEMEGLLLV